MEKNCNMQANQFSPQQASNMRPPAPHQEPKLGVVSQPNQANFNQAFQSRANYAQAPFNNAEQVNSNRQNWQGGGYNAQVANAPMQQRGSQDRVNQQGRPANDGAPNPNAVRGKSNNQQVLIANHADSSLAGIVSAPRQGSFNVETTMPQAPVNDANVKKAHLSNNFWFNSGGRIADALDDCYEYSKLCEQGFTPDEAMMALYNYRNERLQAFRRLTQVDVNALEDRLSKLEHLHAQERMASQNNPQAMAAKHIKPIVVGTQAPSSQVNNQGFGANRSFNEPFYGNEGLGLSKLEMMAGGNGLGGTDYLASAQDLNLLPQDGSNLNRAIDANAALVGVNGSLQGQGSQSQAVSSLAMGTGAGGADVYDEQQAIDDLQLHSCARHDPKKSSPAKNASEPSDLLGIEDGAGKMRQLDLGLESVEELEPNNGTKQLSYSKSNKASTINGARSSSPRSAKANQEQEASLNTRGRLGVLVEKELNCREHSFKLREVPLDGLFGNDQIFGNSFALPVYDELLDNQVPESNKCYVFNDGMLDRTLNFLSNPNHDSLYIVGPTGCGKTSNILEIAARLKWPVETVTLSQRTEVNDLIGHYELVKGELIYQYGPLSRALMFGEILVLNELDMLSGGELAALNDVIEGRSLTITGHNGEIIYPHPYFRLVATANTKGSGDEEGYYQGARTLNQAFLDRWQFLECSYPSVEQEKAMIKALYPNINPDFVVLILRWANMLRYGREDSVPCANGLSLNKMITHDINVFNLEYSDLDVSLFKDHDSAEAMDEADAQEDAKAHDGSNDANKSSSLEDENAQDGDAESDAALAASAEDGEQAQAKSLDDANLDDSAKEGTAKKTKSSSKAKKSNTEASLASDSGDVEGQSLAGAEPSNDDNSSSLKSSSLAMAILEGKQAKDVQSTKQSSEEARRNRTISYDGPLVREQKIYEDYYGGIKRAKPLSADEIKEAYESKQDADEAANELASAPKKAPSKRASKKAQDAAQNSSSDAAPSTSSTAAQASSSSTDSSTDANATKDGSSSKDSSATSSSTNGNQGRVFKSNRHGSSYIFDPDRLKAMQGGSKSNATSSSTLDKPSNQADSSSSNAVISNRLSAPLSSRSLLRICRFYAQYDDLTVQECIDRGYAARLPSDEYEFVMRLSYDVFGYGSPFLVLPHVVFDDEKYLKQRNSLSNALSNLDL